MTKGFQTFRRPVVVNVRNVVHKISPGPCSPERRPMARFPMAPVWVACDRKPDKALLSRKRGQVGKTGQDATHLGCHDARVEIRLRTRPPRTPHAIAQGVVLQ